MRTGMENPGNIVVGYPVTGIPGKHRRFSGLMDCLAGLKRRALAYRQLRSALNRQAFYATDESGRRKRFFLVYTAESFRNGGSFIVYTDGRMDQTGKLNLYGSFCERDASGEIRIRSVNDPAEQEQVQRLLDTLKEDLAGRLGRMPALSRRTGIRW